MHHLNKKTVLEHVCFNTAVALFRFTKEEPIMSGQTGITERYYRLKQLITLMTHAHKGSMMMD